jgi:hypothetical protein
MYGLPRNAGQHVGGLHGGAERAWLDRITCGDLRQARVKIAIGDLTCVFESRHVN